MMARAGKYDGYLLEGMACPGGCMGGAGTLAEPAKAIAALKKYTAEAEIKNAVDTPFKNDLSLLEEAKMNQ
jgi:iron only hydrogenase large subunit-like protein